VKRVCLFCGARISGLKRRDALYCSARHKQAAYRRRAAALPPELWRMGADEYAEVSEDPDMLDALEELPTSDRSFPVVIVMYERATLCVRCGELISEELSDPDPDDEPLPGVILRRSGADYGPFCWIECLVESAHTVR